MYAVQELKFRTEEKENFIQTLLSGISSYCEEDKGLMINVYDIKKSIFLYCSDSYRNVLGYKIEDITGGGWEFWFGMIKPGEAQLLKNKINFLIHAPQPLKLSEIPSFNYHIRSAFDKYYLVSHKLTVYQFRKHFIILSYLYDISQIEKIEYFFGIKNQYPKSAGSTNISISEREKEVLLLIAEGFSSKQIADELYISNHTAIKHRKNLIEKFRVKNTAQLIKEASRLVFFTDPLSKGSKNT